MVRTAPLVIAQVNPNLPYTFGAAELRREEIDWLVPLESTVLELRRSEPGALERDIAATVAESWSRTGRRCSSASAACPRRSWECWAIDATWAFTPA